ncbi:cytochrome P450 CYP12A2-like [Zerene cesonia]|uniref:cytochrome P450 CYP12A2-like n=1 Tax=Zerene cesonia TaxID=33412 RepID=UPI0018E55BB8|nr:cytochrome P450 CYP12A2-like [Zerene cesonia]
MSLFRNINRNLFMSHNISQGNNVRHMTTLNSSSQSLKSYEEIPGLSSLPLIGPLRHFLPVIGTVGPQKTLYDLCKVLYDKYGPIVKLEGIFGRANMLILYEPEHYDQVYRSEEVNPSRPGFQTLVYYRTKLKESRFDGVYGLTTAEGSQWRDFRSKVNPIFLKPKLVKLYAPALSEIADDFISRLLKNADNSEMLNEKLDDDLTKWSLESVAYVGLGSRIGCLRDNLKEDDPALTLIRCAKEVVEYTWELEFKPNPWKYIPTPTFNKVLDTYERQWNTSAFFIKEAQRQINERGHDIPDEDKSIIEKLLAVDEKVAIMMASEMLLAGIDTVAFGVTALLYNMASNPDVQTKLREEIYSSTPSKRYLKACIKESQRLHPVISANLRRTTKDHIVSNYHIPAGIDVLSPNEVLSKMEKHYPKATEFIPERWLVDKSDPLYHGNTHPMVTQPFGFGVRSCIGRRIAELETEILIEKVIQNMSVAWTGPPPEKITKVMNMFKKPYHFKFQRI